MTKTKTINEALREYARRRRLRGFLKLRGKLRWGSDLDETEKLMRALTFLEPSGFDSYVRAAWIYRTLRSRGRTVRSPLIV